MQIPLHCFLSFSFLQLFKDSPQYSDALERMPTERCAKLMALSIANNLDEVWISDHPVLLIVYINQYFPNLFRWYVWITRNCFFFSYPRFTCPIQLPNAYLSYTEDFSLALDVALDVKPCSDHMIFKSAQRSCSTFQNLQA